MREERREREKEKEKERFQVTIGMSEKEILKEIGIKEERERKEESMSWIEREAFLSFICPYCSSILERKREEKENGVLFFICSNLNCPVVQERKKEREREKRKGVKEGERKGERERENFLSLLKQAKTSRQLYLTGMALLERKIERRETKRERGRREEEEREREVRKSVPLFERSLLLVQSVYGSSNYFCALIFNGFFLFIIIQ